MSPTAASPPKPLGGVVAKGIPPMLAIVSDGAWQVDVLEHGICWVLTERRVCTQAACVQRGEQERLRGEILAYLTDRFTIAGNVRPWPISCATPHEPYHHYLRSYWHLR